MTIDELRIAGRIARVEPKTVECLGVVEEGSQLCVDSVEICFGIGQTSGFAHLFDPLLPVSNI